MPSTDYDKSKTAGEFGTFDAKCTSEIKSRIAMTEGAFNKSSSPANWT